MTEVGELATYRCLTCGERVPETRVVPGGAPRQAALASGLAFCSSGCLSAHNSKVFAQPSCLECGSRFEAHPNKQYCSGRCRRAKERRLSRAARAVWTAPGSDPKPSGESSRELLAYVSDLEAALGGLYELQTRLLNRDPRGGDGRFVDEAKLPGEPVSSRVRDLVAREVVRLTGKLNDAKRQQAAAYADEQARAQFSPSLSGSVLTGGGYRQELGPNVKAEWEQERDRWLAATEPAAGEGEVF